jgi:hypothetical protein
LAEKLQRVALRVALQEYAPRAWELAKNFPEMQLRFDHVHPRSF